VTVEQFERQYEHCKPYFEYWFGEPVQKSIPTWLHSLLQKIIMRLLDDAGYVSGAEVKLKISDEFQPLPDVTAVLPGEVELPYPTRPVEVVVEILSPDDQYSQVERKCRYYTQLAIKHIYVVDPLKRQVWTWGGEDGLVITEALTTIPASAIWQELDRNISRKSSLT
jgi:Uma2 family endonuclease